MMSSKNNKSVGINAILNIIKQTCAIVFPLITFPYVSRVLGADNYGKINFSNSVISYFALFAALGISNYAIREGARLRNNRAEFERFSQQVFTINVITTLLSYIVLVILSMVWFKLHDYWILLAIQSITIILTTVGADWVNSVYEDYLYITIRYIVIQVVSLVLVFTFVKDSNDYIIYAMISVLANAGANVLNLFHVRRYARLRVVRHPEIKKHIRPMLTLFCNSLSVQIYINSDITMLGAMQSDSVVGIYSVAVKIYNIIKQLLNAIVVVTIPRISALLGAGDEKSYNKLLDEAFHAIITLVLPSIVGIFMLSSEIIHIVGGEEYAEGYMALSILSIALIGATFANFFNNAILVPNKKEKYFLRATITAACVNVGMNLILIPFISYIGAAITTVIAELVVLAFGVHYSKGLYDFKFCKRDIMSVCVGCLVICGTCLITKGLVYSLIPRVIICVSVSVFLYFAFLALFKNRLVLRTLKSIEDKIKG